MAAPRRSALVRIVLVALAITACVPQPAGRTTAPASPAASTASVTPLPSPTGPTPRPSFVRPTPLPSPTFLVYVVEAGDTLASIARRFSTTAFSVAAWNRAAHPNLDPDSAVYDPDHIKVGWALRLIPGHTVDEEDLLEPTPDPSATAP